MKRDEHIFKLKGSREYVHGTDIFDFLLKNFWAGPERTSNIEITFSRRLENTACLCKWTDQEGELVMRAAPCRGKYQVDDVMHYFSISPQDQDGPRARFDYDESEMTAIATVSSTGAAVEINRKYTCIENLVALTKHFHNSHYKPHRNQWMLGKLELVAVPENVRTLEVGLQSMVVGKLSKCSVVANGVHVGDIYFTVG